MSEVKGVLYICDQLQCENCSAAEGLCHHTTDISHAANFVKVDEGIYVETEVIKALKPDEHLADPNG
jgi:hypothetical protein